MNKNNAFMYCFLAIETEFVIQLSDYIREILLNSAFIAQLGK